MENITKIYFIVTVIDLVLGIIYLCVMPFLAVHAYSDYVRISEEINELKIGYTEIQDEIEAKNSEVWSTKEYDYLASLMHMLSRYELLVEEKSNKKDEFLGVIALVAALVLYGLLIVYFAYKLAQFTLKLPTIDLLIPYMEEIAFSVWTTTCFYWIVTNTISLGFVVACWISDWNYFGKIMGYLETTGELFSHFFTVYLSLRVTLMFIVSVSTLVCVSRLH